jgi:glycosyltransferase involved in cell wall biosynthesis
LNSQDDQALHANTLESLPKFTVITPTLNSAKTLERAIQSLIHQQYPNLEYIIIDGASTDGTVEIIKQYQAHVSKWISEKDENSPDAMNKGIRMASGDIIGFLLSDDFYLEHALDKVALAAKQDPQAEVFYGDMVYVGPLRPPFRVHAKPGITKSDFYHMPVPVYLPALFVRRECFAKHGLLDVNYPICNDYEILLRFADAGVRFHHVDEVLVSMQWGGSSSRPSRRTGEEFLAAFYKYKPSLITQLRFKRVWYINLTKGLLKAWPVTQPLVQFYRSIRNKIVPSYHPPTDAES